MHVYYVLCIVECILESCGRESAIKLQVVYPLYSYMLYVLCTINSAMRRNTAICFRIKTINVHDHHNNEREYILYIYVVHCYDDHGHYHYYYDDMLFHRVSIVLYHV